MGRKGKRGGMSGKEDRTKCIYLFLFLTDTSILGAMELEIYDVQRVDLKRSFQSRQTKYIYCNFLLRMHHSCLFFPG